MNGWEIANLVTWSVAIVVNGIAAFTNWINGTTIQKVSDDNPTKLTPERFTFGIWGVIYGFFLLFTIYTLVHLDVLVRQLTIWVILLAVFNIAWVFTFLYEYFYLSFITCLLQIASLVGIYHIYAIKYTNSMTVVTAFVYYAPFSIYLAWVIFATVANASIVIFRKSTDKNEAGQTGAIILAALLYSAIASAMLIFRNDFAFGLVALWALVGLLIKDYTIQDKNLGSDETDWIQTTLIISIVILLASAGVSIYLFLNNIIV